MITEKSFKEYVGRTLNTRAEVNVHIENENKWTFYYFNGEIDSYVDMGYLNPETLEMTVLFSGYPFNSIDICQGFLEGWIFDDFEFNTEYHYLQRPWDEERIEMAKYLKQVLTDAELYDTCIELILRELEDALIIEHRAEYACENTLKQIRQHK